MSDFLTELSVKLAQIIFPMIMLLNITGNSLNIFVLTRANLRNHACSRYFLALASNNLIYSLYIINYLLATGFNIDVQAVSDALCKILQYGGSVCPFLSPYFIVLASIDRFCASSSNVKLRRFSNVVVANWSILIVVVCTLLFFINTLVSYDLRDDGYGCTIRTDTFYKQMFVLVQAILYAAVPPCLMMIFGLLTIYNTSRLQVIPRIRMNYRRTESQLARMLFIQVAIHVILSMPLSILYLILILPTTYIPTPEFYFAFTITPFFYYFSYVTPFFLYTLSARVYREELFRLISRICRIRGRVQVQPISMTHFHHATTVPRHTTTIGHH